MLLCIDCGNTRLKWGLHDGRQWRAQGVLMTDEIAQLPLLLASQPHPRRAVACNVASDTAGTAIETAVAQLGLELAWATSHAEQCGVKNGYDDPRQLGPDRWLALVGARHMHRGACLVVNAGTATTVDVLDAQGIFQGGLILPGINLMHAALASETARLPLAQGHFSRLPRNTADAIVSGSLLATTGAVSLMYEHVAADPAAMCLLSGGAADLLAPLLSMPLSRVDNLVLEGLSCVARQVETRHD